MSLQSDRSPDDCDPNNVAIALGNLHAMVLTDRYWHLPEAAATIATVSS